MTDRRLTNESEEYAQHRNDLLSAEQELRDQRERVAAMRRSLPEGPVVDDYIFREAAAGSSGREVALSSLFDDGHETLILIHFMYGGAQRKPCPMCSMWADGYNAIGRHVRRRAGFALVAEAPIEEFAALAHENGWDDVRLLSSEGNGFKTDFAMQDADGNQSPGVSVFRRGADGSIRHFYTGEANLQDSGWRGVDLLSPVWHLFDLTPEGRGDWMPNLSTD